MGTSRENRAVIRVTGADRVDFLQGLVSNDLRRIGEGPLYAALLTPQGKYIADFILLAQGEAILIDVDAGLAAPLMQRLSMYKLRADVTLEMSDIAVARGIGPTPEGALADPRHPGLGWRGYNGQASEEVDWNAVYVANCVPRSGIELSGESYILEAGFERLAGVDFRKGCYVGQEVTARMKHKTELKKGLALVQIDGTAPVGTEILTEGGKPAGTLYSQAGGQAIAYLRFDRASGEMQAGEARIIYSPSD